MPLMNATPDVNDFGQINSMRVSAQHHDPQALRAAARQFEAMMTQQMLKAAHAAKLGDDGLGGEQGEIYQDMFDQQLAQQMSKGRGLGIADMLVHQLQKSQAAKAAPATTGGIPLQNPAIRKFLPLAPRAYAPAVTPGAATVPAAQTPASPATQTPAVSSVQAATPLAAQANATLAQTVAVAGSEGSANPTDFITRLLPQAQAAAKELGVSPRVLVAQAALETGWGKHVIKNADGSPSYNFFGIKANGNWQGARVSKTTQEYSPASTGPHAESAEFRSYASPEAAFKDYVGFLKAHPRYSQALNHGGNSAQFASGLQKAGYATDPHYADKISRIANGSLMTVALARINNKATTQEIA
jgi:flagellar protein FlgJ